MLSSAFWHRKEVVADSGEHSGDCGLRSSHSVVCAFHIDNCVHTGERKNFKP